MHCLASFDLSLTASPGHACRDSLLLAAKIIALRFQRMTARLQPVRHKPRIIHARKDRKNCLPISQRKQILGKCRHPANHFSPHLRLQYIERHPQCNGGHIVCMLLLPNLIQPNLYALHQDIALWPHFQPSAIFLKLTVYLLYFTFLFCLSIACHGIMKNLTQIIVYNIEFFYLLFLANAPLPAKGIFIFLPLPVPFHLAFRQGSYF